MRDADSFMVRKIGVNNRRGSGAAGISIVETVLNGDATHIGRSLRSTATSGNAPLQPLRDPRPKVSGGWMFAVRSVAQHRKPLSHSWRGENRLGDRQPDGLGCPHRR